MKRIFGIDLLKTIAVIMVISVHFFLNNGFYDVNINGIGMFISIIFRWFFYICVPIFILVTGYLCKDKKLEKKYYKGLKKVLLSYLFISIICILFKHFYLHEHARKLKLLISIFDFTADGYSWYVEMYIGLFLIIPFLNILYNGLETRNNKRILIFILGLLVSIQPLINYLHISNIKLDIIPDWWTRFYPLIYYFIGCYIKEYQIKINKYKGIILFILIILLESIISFLYNYNSTFSWDFIGGYGSLQVVILSTIFFLLIYNIKCDKKIINKIINKVSLLSLDIYLFSYIVDSVIYNKLGEKLDGPVDYLKYMIPIILFVFISSFILSYIKDIIFKFIEFINKKIFNNNIKKIPQK
jgi:surface polysaccharide O-acyltransferase-like enzyme